MRSSAVTTKPRRLASRPGSPRSAAASRSPACTDDGLRPGVTGFFTDSAGATFPYLAIAFLAAGVLSFLLTPLIRRIAIRFDAIDHPEHRRVNEVPVPRGGGVAVAIAFVLVSIGLLVYNDMADFVAVPTNVDLPELVGLLLGGILATAFGVLDDALD